MKTIILKNTFHNTEMKIKTDSDEIHDAINDLNYLVYSKSDTKARAKLARIKRTLCGMADCHCESMIEISV